jgi:RNA polymerase sigma-70 factor (ECF subfamily)
MTIGHEITEDAATADQTASVDTIVVERALSEGPDAFRAIVERFQSAVFAVALSRDRDFHLAEDIAQQVFIEAYQKLASLKEPEKLGGWLRTIAIRKSVNVIRSSRNEVAIQQDGSDGLLIGDADEDLEREDLKRRVSKAIGRLRETQRETTILFYIEGYSTSEIASMLDVPTGTVKRRLHDARAKLKLEMLGLVKDTLTSEKPDDNFGEQVFTIIRQYATERGRKWTEGRDHILAMGLDGIEGLQKAIESPHGLTRRKIPHLIVGLYRRAAQDHRREVLVELLKKCLTDPNKKVREFAVTSLFLLDVEEDRKHDEFVPLVVDRFADRLGIVRYVTAQRLCRYFKNVPLDKASAALVKADEKTRRVMTPLVGRIIENQAA